LEILQAILDAEYTEAPASETIKLAPVYQNYFLDENSVSREAVPFPIEMHQFYRHLPSILSFHRHGSFVLWRMGINSFIV
jgi:hypothetical protein